MQQGSPLCEFLKILKNFEKYFMPFLGSFDTFPTIFWWNKCVDSVLTILSFGGSNEEVGGSNEEVRRTNRFVWKNRHWMPVALCVALFFTKNDNTPSLWMSYLWNYHCEKWAVWAIDDFNSKGRFKAISRFLKKPKL